MNLFKHLNILVVSIILSGLTVIGMTGCANVEEDMVQNQYGYAQFRLYKSSSYDKDIHTKASAGKVDLLADVQKIKVVLQYNGANISQMLRFNSYNAENGEYGLRSDKLQLLPGDYKIVGYTLYDKVDSPIESVSMSVDNNFNIISGGLTIKDLTVDAVPRGKVSFRLVKDFIGTRADEPYPFASIKAVDLTVKNMVTNEKTEIRKVRVKYVEDFGKEEDKTIEIAYAECDTVVFLKAGNYQISSYKTYSDKKAQSLLEYAKLPSSKTFIVKDNAFTEHAEVPIRLSETDEYIKDYIALKEIWEALDGPNWKYYGEDEAMGTNWNFDKEIDMWGYQPGVQLHPDGRVATLSVAGMGAKGVVPEAIGQLTELKILSLGTHSDKLGGHLIENFSPSMTKEQRMATRQSYENLVLAKDIREDFCQEMQDAINEDPHQKPIRKSTRSKNIQPMKSPDFTNGIRGISKAMMRITGLEQFYIANAPIRTEDFFVPLSADSKYKYEESGWSWNKFNNLFDIEIYNCVNLTGLPMDFLNGLPEIQSLNIACSVGISGEQLRADWINYLRNGKSVDKIQILYMGFNNLEEFPEYEDLKKMTKLGMLDCTTNKIKKLHPFGKEVQLVKLYLDYNQITEIPKAPDGYFFGYNDVEGISFSHNKLTEFPDIFNAKSVYVMSSADFSFNDISSFENGENHKGINVGQLNLTQNKFETFPAQLFKSGSPLNYLILAGNGMKTIPKGSLQGPNSHMLVSLDLSYNRLKELPTDDFIAKNLPYFYGIDISYNSFSKFPYAALDAAGVSIMNIRHQRDENGNRCLKEWPTGIYQCPSLIRFLIGSNDLGKIEDTISPYIRLFDIKDNPNISIDLGDVVCSYIKAGIYQLVYDSTQDIRGCDDALDLDK